GARRIRAQVAAYGRAEVEQVLQFATDRQRLPALAGLYTSLPPNSVIVTNWTQFPVYESADFGGGLPIDFRFPAVTGRGGLRGLGVVAPEPRDGATRWTITIPGHLAEVSRRWDWTTPASAYPLGD